MKQYVNGKSMGDKDYVDLTSNQSVSGQKTFLKQVVTHGSLLAVSDSVDVTTIPDTRPSVSSLRYVDKNGETLGAAYPSQETDGTNRCVLEVRNFVNGTPEDGTKYNFGGLELKNTGTQFIGSINASSKLVNNNLSTARDNTSSTEIALKGWVNNPATALNVVHRTGDETIKGVKTFNGNYYVIKSLNIDETVTPTSTQYCTIQWHDKNDKEIGAVYSAKSNGGTNFVELHATGHTSDGTHHLSYINLAVDPKTGGASAKTINPNSNSNDTSIATTKWVNDKLNNYVTTNTNQIINGIKTFNRHINLNVVDDNESTNLIQSQDKTVAFEDDKTRLWFHIRNYDKNTKEMANWYCCTETSNGVRKTRIDLSPKAYDAEGNLKSCNFRIFQTPTEYQLTFTGSNGVTNVNLSSASSSTGDANVALKGWCNNPATSTNIVHRTGDESITGTKTFNGFVIHGNSLKMGNDKAFQFLDSSNMNVVDIRSDPSGNFMFQSQGGTKNIGYSNFNNIFYNGATSLCFNNTGSTTIAKINQGTTGTLYISNTKDVDATGTQAFKVPTPTSSSNNKEAVNLEYLNTKFQVVNQLPSSPNSNTFYFIPE